MPLSMLASWEGSQRSWAIEGPMEGLLGITVEVRCSHLLPLPAYPPGCVLSEKAMFRQISLARAKAVARQ